MSNVDVRPLDEAYLEWLYSQIGTVQNSDPAYNHWNLLRKFYVTQFNDSVPNDDNRASDGKELRIEFLQQTGFPLDDPYGDWFNLDCSVLEMMIALARRVAFEDETLKSPVEWFWLMTHNLGLDAFTDDIYEISMDEEVGWILDRFNRREYERNGQGGLFPLQRNRNDQRRVELWAQMSAYLLEGMFQEVKPRW